MPKTRSGLDEFLSRSGKTYRKARLGLIAHAASVTSALEPSPEALIRSGFRLSALFAPEHGIAGALQDQITVGPARHKTLGIPVHSLYGDPARPEEFSRLSPTEHSLRSVDVMLCDLQDIGIRYYTFAWTMTLALEACARRKIPFVVLDRPNPLGGERTEGNLVDPAYRSFVGLHPVPVRHGLTMGELALWINATRRIGADLRVVPMKNWRRRMRFEDTGLPWVMPSPNMPSLETVSVYAGACLVEGTLLSEGRGTTRPFELIGAPFIDENILAGALRKINLPGVRFRPCVFQPGFHKWAGQPCGGVQLHVTDRKTFRSFLTGLALLATTRRLWPHRFRWRPPPYEFEDRTLPIDMLCGTPAVREALERGRDLFDLEKTWGRDRRRFLTETRPFHLYG